MPRAKRQQPFDPNRIHDRRSTDKLKDAQLAPQEVDDPFEQGGKIIVMRSIRNDPLGALHARGSIDEAQYLGGRAFQKDFEDAEQGPRAIDYEAPGVDCSRVDRSMSPKISEAMGRLAKAYKALEQDGSAFMHDFLIYGRSMAEIGKARGLVGRSWEEYCGAHVRRHLLTLAEVYGFAMIPSGKKKMKNPIKIGV